VVPCRNEKENIGLFLNNLLNQRDVPGPLEFLIADGNSEDGTWEILQEWATKFPSLVILRNRRRIVSAGLNQAIQKARGSIIVRMDVHTEYAEDYIAQCVSVLKETGAANVGGGVRTLTSGYIGRAIAAAYQSRFGVGGARFHFPDFEGEVDTVPFGCWERQTLLSVGLFDEALVRNQDDELNFRLRQAGGKIWQSADIRSWYKPRQSLRALFNQYFQYGFWKVAVIRKHGKPASLRHLVPGLFVMATLVLGLFSLTLPIAGAGLQIVSGSYLLFLATGSVWIAKAEGWDLLPVLPLILATFHLAYGIGFLVGMVVGPKHGGNVAKG